MRNQGTETLSNLPKVTKYINYGAIYMNPGSLNPNSCLWTAKPSSVPTTFTYLVTIRKCLEKAMAPHSSTLVWKIPWMEETGRLQSMGSLESDTTERLHFQFSLSCIGEGNGNPLQCSCLENPRDGKPGGLQSMGLQSRTRLKRRSSSSRKCL